MFLKCFGLSVNFLKSKINLFNMRKEFPEVHKIKKRYYEDNIENAYHQIITFEMIKILIEYSNFNFNYIDSKYLDKDEKRELCLYVYITDHLSYNFNIYSLVISLDDLNSIIEGIHTLKIVKNFDDEDIDITINIKIIHIFLIHNRSTCLINVNIEKVNKVKIKGQYVRVNLPERMKEFDGYIENIRNSVEIKYINKINELYVFSNIPNIKFHCCPYIAKLKK